MAALFLQSLLARFNGNTRAMTEYLQQTAADGMTFAQAACRRRLTPVLADLVRLGVNVHVWHSPEPKGAELCDAAMVRTPSKPPACTFSWTSCLCGEPDERMLV